MTLPGTVPLQIPPATQVCEPITFVTVIGDGTGEQTDRVRTGVADVRLEVFVGEQDVALVEEIDARDDQRTTVHVLAAGADGTPLAAGRVLAESGHPGEAHLGRLAVRMICRGTGLGARMVAALEEVALEHAGASSTGGCRQVTVVLSAQEQAMGFYERCGYQVVNGRRYLDAGIWHQDMARVVIAGER